MTNEIKLLYALCEALGFEVETTLDYMPRKESLNSAQRYMDGRTGLDRVLASNRDMLDIDGNGKYTSLLVSPVIDYKLHKIEADQ